MAGIPKKTIDYAGWNTDIFENEPKIDKLLDAQGWIGFSIYFYLCQRAYGSEGYYYRWSYDDGATTARKMGCGIRSETVKQTVATCLQIGLFDKRLFEEDGVLTSRGIQKKYWRVASERTDRSVIAEYWLLHDKECRGCIKVALSPNDEGSACDVKGSTCDVQPINKSKVNKSIDNDNSDTSIFDVFENSFARPLTQIEMVKISDALQDSGEELLRYALELSVMTNKVSMAYITAILNNWRTAGVKDRHQAELYSTQKKSNTKKYTARKATLPKDFEDNFKDCQKEEKPVDQNKVNELKERMKRLEDG